MHSVRAIQTLSRSDIWSSSGAELIFNAGGLIVLGKDGVLALRWATVGWAPFWQWCMCCSRPHLNFWGELRFLLDLGCMLIHLKVSGFCTHQKLWPRSSWTVLTQSYDKLTKRNRWVQLWLHLAKIFLPLPFAVHRCKAMPHTSKMYFECIKTVYLQWHCTKGTSPVFIVFFILQRRWISRDWSTFLSNTYTRYSILETQAVLYRPFSNNLLEKAA